MKELCILLAPVFWSLKNDIIRFNRSFYKKILYYTAASALFIFLVTKLLSIGMAKLQSLSPDVFNLLLIKGYALIFLIIFFVQIINGFVISLNSYYQSKELEVLFTSPVNRTSLFFSRLFETHIKASWMLVIFGIPLLVSSGLLYHAGIFYYVYAMALFFAFSSIPVNIGAGFTIFLSSFFHARKLKKLLLSTGIVAVVLLVTLLRIFKPERFVNPELFANLTLFVNEIKTPSFILLPNRWLSESIFNFLGNSFTGETFLFISLLLMTSYITTLFLHLVFKKYHYKGWGLLQDSGIILKGKRLLDSQRAPVGKGITLLRLIDPLIRMLDVQSRLLIKKDLLSQMRDVRNIHQILALAALIVIYLFSIASLPLNWEGYAVQLRYIISFFNLGLILIIIAAICSRLVYPAVVAEETSVWIIKTSPLMPLRFVWTKFLLFFVPVFIVGQVLVVFSSFFIGVEKAFLFLQIATTALLSLSLVSVTMTFGIGGIRPGAADTSQERGRTGSSAHMLASVFLVLFTLALEAIPLYLYFLREAKKGAFTQEAWMVIGAVIFVLFLVNLFVTALSMRLGVKRFERLEKTS